jgi:site-specific DNA-methyltransferase (cytosine-N4-specific)
MPCQPLPAPAYSTALGACHAGDSRELLQALPDGSVNLVMTSPPFPLQRQKEYGNLAEREHVDWLVGMCAAVLPKLAADGSMVIDLGGTYHKGVPVRSLWPFRLLLRLCDDLGFRLAEDFYWHNPAKLPSPIEWVNKRKVRAKDSVNTVWWLSRSDHPKADVSKVLVPYSESMRKLLAEGEKATKLRPSGHEITNRFLKDNGGAIPPNLLQISNTESNGVYQARCRRLGLKAHPARFPAALPDFFIRFLTDPGDLVLDIFAGSNTTGQAAEAAGRRWFAFEKRIDYVANSAFRFMAPDIPDGEASRLHAEIEAGLGVDFALSMLPKAA